MFNNIRALKLHPFFHLRIQKWMKVIRILPDHHQNDFENNVWYPHSGMLVCSMNWAKMIFASLSHFPKCSQNGAKAKLKQYSYFHFSHQHLYLFDFLNFSSITCCQYSKLIWNLYFFCDFFFVFKCDFIIGFDSIVVEFCIGLQLFCFVVVKQKTSEDALSGIW